MVEILPRSQLRAPLVTTPVGLAADPDARVRLPRFELDVAQFTSGRIRVEAEITWDGITWQSLGVDEFVSTARRRDGSAPIVQIDVTRWGDDDRPMSPLGCRWVVSPVTGRPVVGATISERRNPDAPPAVRHHSIALTQSAEKVTTGTGTTLAFSSNIAAAALLCNTHSTYSGSANTINTPTDTRSSSYAAMTTQQGNSAVQIRSYYAVSGSSGACTVTFDADAGIDLTVVIAEFSGAATTSPLDNSSTGTGTSSSPSSGAVTPSEDNCMLYGAGMHDGSDTTWTQGGTLIQETEGGTSNMPVAVQYIVQTTATSQAATWTLGASRTWWAHHGVFKAAGGGGVTTRRYSLSLTGVG